jgi:hypothetical protein
MAETEITPAPTPEQSAQAAPVTFVPQKPGHPNVGGNRGGFNGNTDGYIPSAEEKAEAERVAAIVNGNP